jgi:hypothetical protein
MPELPDIQIYLEALERTVKGQALESIRIGSPFLRIVYADNEANYCADCQTGGRVLRDRALSRLLKADWPRSIDEMEARMGREIA